MKKLNVRDYVDSQYEILKKKKNNKKHFRIFQIGNEQASNKYVNNKLKKCKMLGIDVILEKILSNDINSINTRLDNEWDNGNKVMLQFPVPDGVEMPEITELQDVDGLTYRNNALLFSDKSKEFIEDNIFFNIPCTARGVAEYIDYEFGDTTGKTALVIGRSKLVGKPLARLLEMRNMTVMQANSYTPKSTLHKLLEVADYVIVAVGQEGFITSNDIKDGTVVIDVGINFTEENKLVGDFKVLPEDHNKMFSYTPVPNGVGQLTVLSLMKNILEIPLYTKE